MNSRQSSCLYLGSVGIEGLNYHVWFCTFFFFAFFCGGGEFCLLVCFLRWGSHCVILAGLGLTEIRLSLPPKC